MNSIHERDGRSGILAVEGASLRYLVAGSGIPTLVFGSTLYYPRTFASSVLEHLQLIHLDARHFAPSDPAYDISQITIDTYTHDIEQLRQTLDLDRVVVMGHSIHGTVALEYARRYPQYVAGVIMLGALPRGMDDTATASAVFWQTDASQDRQHRLQQTSATLTPELLATLTPGAVLIRTYVANGPRYWYDPDYDAAWLWEGVTPNVDILNRVFGELFATYDLQQGPEQIRVPVLVIHGRFDYSVPYTLWEAHQSKVPQLTYHLFDRSGHTPQLEEAQRCAQAMVEWVRGLDRKPSCPT